MTKFFFQWILFGIVNVISIYGAIHANQDQAVLFTKRIQLKEFPGAFNPSIVYHDGKFILTFRYCPKSNKPWISYIGVVLLDGNLELASRPQLLNVRMKQKKKKVPSQAEDARIFTHNGSIYLLYNDNPDVTNPQESQRRDMFISQLKYYKGRFTLSKPTKLVHPQRLQQAKQKNWVPFTWEKQLLLAYTLNPHEILLANVGLSACLPLCSTQQALNWKWGELRGGSAACLVGDEYLAFFHSSMITTSDSSQGMPMHHYYMGAYTFSRTPPFNLSKISPEPIFAEGFYTYSDYDKRVIFPGGYATVDSNIYIAYGKDDREVWIAVLDKKQLLSYLKPIDSL